MHNFGPFKATKRSRTLLAKLVYAECQIVLQLIIAENEKNVDPKHAMIIRKVHSAMRIPNVHELTLGPRFSLLSSEPNGQSDRTRARHVRYHLSG